MKFVLLLVWSIAGLLSSELPVVTEDQPYRRIFTVTNPYDRAIRITVIDATCTCSTLELADRFLLPGGTSTLTMVAENQRLSGTLRRRIWLYCSDPEYEAIELTAEWQVQPLVYVDLLPPESTSTADRPAENAWRDIYRYTADVRPDELDRLRKVIRIGCPPEQMPEGGLELGPISYAGDLWRFETRRLDACNWLLVARAAERSAPPAERVYQEPVIVTTNHPGKARLELEFLANISVDAGNGSDPFAKLR